MTRANSRSVSFLDRTQQPYHHRAFSSASASDLDAVAERPASGTFRDCYCGHVSYDANAPSESKIKISGWVHSYRHLGKHGVCFAVIRDWTGMVQVTWQAKDSAALIKGTHTHSAGAEAGGDLDGEGSLLPLESVVTVTGIVRQRPKDMVNPDMATGDVEMVVESVEVLNVAKEAPVQVKASVAAAAAASTSKGGKGGKGGKKGKKGKPGEAQDKEQKVEQSEDFLLKHRHLHLRMPHMQRNLRIRSHVTNEVRRQLSSENFAEVSEWLAGSYGRRIVVGCVLTLQCVLVGLVSILSLSVPVCREGK